MGCDFVQYLIFMVLHGTESDSEVILEIWWGHDLSRSPWRSKFMSNVAFLRETSLSIQNRLKVPNFWPTHSLCHTISISLGRRSGQPTECSYIAIFKMAARRNLTCNLSNNMSNTKWAIILCNTSFLRLHMVLSLILRLFWRFHEAMTFQGQIEGQNLCQM